MCKFQKKETDMKANDFIADAMDSENATLMCYGCPKGDELPQVAGMEDILIDVYSDMLNMPRDYAASRLHHQYEDEFEGFETLIH